MNKAKFKKFMMACPRPDKILYGVEKDGTNKYYIRHECTKYVPEDEVYCRFCGKLVKCISS